MRTVGNKWVGLVVTSLLVSGPAIAGSNVDDDLAQMRELVKGLEQKLDAQQEQIEHQSGMLQDAQQVVRDQQEQEKGALSGVGEFWQAIDVNMSVAGSYAYNFHNPTSSSGGSGAANNGGNSALFYPFHPDHNSFQVDQVWFDIGKATTAESRAGFHATILYGTTAAFLGQGATLSRRSFDNDSTSDYYVHQAYVNWLAPVGEGVEFTFGKFATPLGAEVADASKNWNVTRGNVYNLLQPIDHLGLMASTNVGPITIAAGVVNQANLTTSSPDVNSEKSYLGKVAFSTDAFSVGTTLVYGAENATIFDINEVEDRTGLVDLLATFNSDAFSLWANADYTWIEGSRAAAWGLAVAGMVPITDDFSAALRLEYVRDKEAVTGVFAPGTDFLAIGPANTHVEVYGATGTLAYELAENLTLKTEVRYDRVTQNDLGGPEEFITNTSSGDDEQVVGLAQVIYAF